MPLVKKSSKPAETPLSWAELDGNFDYLVELIQDIVPGVSEEQVTEIINTIIVFDATPTAGSNNHVKSKDIKAYVDNNTGVSEALKAFRVEPQFKNYTEWGQYFFAASKISSIAKSANIATVQYKIGAGGYVTPALPLAADIDVPANTTVTWKITFVVNQTEGALSIKGREV